MIIAPNTITVAYQRTNPSCKLDIILPPPKSEPATPLTAWSITAVSTAFQKNSDINI